MGGSIELPDGPSGRTPIAAASLAEQNGVNPESYLVLFEDLIVGTYANRFKNYSNEKLAVYGTTSRGQIVIVKSHLEQDSQKPIRVDWRVKFPDGKYKIFDIVVEGISMIQTQRSEFSSVIRRNGGKVSDLLTALRQKSTSSN